MFWADRIAKEIQETRTASGKPLVIRDEKTISGRVHIGSMRGVAIHGLIAEVLSEYNVPNEYHYELNDFDPFDSIPGYLDAEIYTPFLGMPLYKVQPPGQPAFVDTYAQEYVAVHAHAGFTPTYYHSYADLYQAGKMDTYIKTALERAADVRRILKETSGSVKDDTWLPVSVVCEQCGKMMSTRAFDFDGDTVAYVCDRTPDGVVPCGHEGRITPWKGAAKLFWKVEWAAKWCALGVDVEGAGKDHSTRGGSRDVANHISREIFNREPPFDIPYEFFLVGGKKMSSSKGRGSSAKEISDLFPAEVFRLILIGKDINQQIDVDPEGDSVPRMYDWYDEIAEKKRQGIADDFTRLYALAQLPENQADAPTPWQMRFGQVAFIVQMPHIVALAEAARIKGAPLTKDEKETFAERSRYAEAWLTTYAPEQFVYKLQDELPSVSLTDAQKKALATLAEYFTEERSGEEVHARLHELKTEIPIEPKELFSAIYLILLARTSGPKAGWFLSVLPRNFVIQRLREASV